MYFALVLISILTSCVSSNQLSIASDFLSVNGNDGSIYLRMFCLESMMLGTGGTKHREKMIMILKLIQSLL